MLRIQLARYSQTVGQYSQNTPQLNDTIIVAMSSGVDSSVCAALYSKYPNVKGVYMANWSQEAECTERDWKDVQKVCQQLAIPCERVSFEKEYWVNVFEPMISQYQQGHTPNPDVDCNKYIKFGTMIRHLEKQKQLELGSNWWLVTGHYARILHEKKTNQYHLLRATYREKDQSYYLSSVPPSIFPRLILPLGNHTKPQVRHLAHQHNLVTRDKPDSQGLCFVSQKGQFRDFLNSYLEPCPGNIVLEDGTVVGRHQGIWHATIGQSAGISMPQGSPEFKGKWFVSEKRPASNEIVIVRGGNHPSLFANEIVVNHWSGDRAGLCSGGLTVQFRSLQEPIEVLDILENDRGQLTVTLKQLAKAIAPGQQLVIYAGDRILGTGTIEKAQKSASEAQKSGS